MKRFITAVLIVATVLMAMAVPTEASESGRWITKSFKYEGYCPTVKLRIEGLGERYVSQNITSTTKAKAMEFVIIPTEYNGYYVIRSTENPHIALTFKDGKFKLSDIDNGDYTSQVFAKEQMFRFVWKTGYAQGYNNRKCNGWQIVCKNGRVLTCSGYSAFGMWQTNY